MKIFTIKVLLTLVYTLLFIVIVPSLFFVITYRILKKSNWKVITTLKIEYTSYRRQLKHLWTKA